MTGLGSFSDLANTRVGDVEPPKLVPAGHYQCQFTGLATEHKSAVKKTLAARFPFKVIAPGEDVDQAELAAVGGLPEKTFNLDFWLTPDSLFRLTDFGKAMGHSEDLNLVELLEALGTSGEPFLLEARHEPNSQDPTKPPFLRWDNPTAIA